MNVSCKNFWTDGLTILLVEYHLHEYLLALWGCPLGEMLDLERLSQTCKEKNRWTFFVTSAPANVPGKKSCAYNLNDPANPGCTGGVGSHVNGTAIF